MKIYLTTEDIQERNRLLQDKETPSITKLGLLQGKAVAFLEQGKRIGGTLTDLGIHPDDTTARECMKTLLARVADASMLPLENSPGVYFVTDQTEMNIAVFKMGEQRASTELLVRELAFLLHLEDSVPPGIFCAVEDLTISEEFDKRLWNGKLAAYEPPPELRKTANRISKKAVGILQPFIQDISEGKRGGILSPQDFEHITQLILLALAANIRDCKWDGIAKTESGYVTFDNEDSLFLNQNPEPGIDDPTSIDLRFLSELDLEAHIEPRLSLEGTSGAQTPLSSNLPPELIKKLRALVAAWDVAEIMNTLKEESILFLDEKAENGESTDAGGNSITLVEKDGSERSVNYLDKETNPNRRALLPFQIQALRERLTSLKRLIGTMESFSLQELIFGIDPRFKVLHDLFKEKQEAGTLAKAYRGTPYDSLGRKTPSQLGLSFRGDSPFSPLGGKSPPMPPPQFVPIQKPEPKRTPPPAGALTTTPLQ